MDDYTWRMRLAARRRRRQRERLFLLALFVMALTAVFLYFSVYTKTPEYAMREMVAAYRAGDSSTFKRHVDLPSITLQAYDDLTSDLFKYDTQLTERERSLFENFYVLIRRQMCKGAAKVIDTYIDTREWTLPGEILKGRQLGIDYDLLLDRSLIRHTSLIDLEEVEHHGEEAFATFSIVEEYSQVPFTLKVTLKDLANEGFNVGGSEFELFGKKMKFPGFTFNLGGSDWKIVSVDNYRGYLDAVSPILRKNLADYIDDTEEIVYRYNQFFAAAQNNFISLQRSPYGIMLANQRVEVSNYVTGTIIPALENRQAELDQVPVPQGAQFLASLRQESTRVTIMAWESYIKGITENSATALDTAESLHKQELVLDQRIEEIVHNSAIARNLPELP
ncbi:MAG: DUF2939 domain-containing protein [Selenomonadaceae bacterium]|nr:DUF2939 domain-containing protein [Selenomonadaceae bacterium]